MVFFKDVYYLTAFLYYAVSCTCIISFSVSEEETIIFIS